MKRIDDNFNYSERLNEKIWCVECVTNDEEENSRDIYECENEQEAIKECNRLNDTNQDKKYKFIVIQYTVLENCLQCI